MKQPKRKIIKESKEFGGGIDYCTECPFLKFIPYPICNTSDEVLEYDKDNKIPVPDWCGNKKH